jgi:RimJ/RimL family protein N-acetyltransferase
VRRPREDDLGDVFRIHGDPRTNTNNPSGPDRDRDMSHKRLSEWLEHWEEHGFGYWTVELAGTQINDKPCREVVGFAGVRHDTWLGTPVLNLYYRFAPEYWGRGYAGEVASHAAAWAISHHPQLPVLARTKPENIGSQRTAESAGLRRRPDLEADDGTGPVVILVSSWPE